MGLACEVAGAHLAAAVHVRDPSHLVYADALSFLTKPNERITRLRQQIDRQRRAFASHRNEDAALFIGLLACSSAAWAHKPSDSYLRLAAPEPNGEGLRMALRWDLALRDLDQTLPLDADGDRAIIWSELRAADAPIRALRINLRASLGGAALRDRRRGRPARDPPLRWRVRRL